MDPNARLDPTGLSAGPLPSIAPQQPARERRTPFRDSSAGDWDSWLRGIERRRRLLARAGGAGVASVVGPDYFRTATLSSFRLDEIELTDRDVTTALATGRRRQALRSRQAQRIRNHVAILYHIESSLRSSLALTAAAVVRWYTSICCGLSTGMLTDVVMDRIDQVVRRINSPHLRLQPALQEVARTYVQLLTDPLVPSFNGLLARLLLRYHLGRCGMPPVVFDPEADAHRMNNDQMLLPRLMDLITHGLDARLSALSQSNGQH